MAVTYLKSESMNNAALLEVLKNLLTGNVRKKKFSDAFAGELVAFVERALEQGVVTGELEKYLDEHLGALQEAEKNEDLKSFCWRNRDTADYLFVERHLARVWIYEQKYYYWKEKGVIFYSWDYLYDGNQWYRFDEDFDYLRPVQESPNTFYLNPINYSKRDGNFCFPKCKNYDWWEENLSEFEYAHNLSGADRFSIFPVSEDFITELISKISKNPEYAVKC